MKALIVEDDFASRKLLNKFLEPYGVCDTAEDGAQGVDLFQAALENNEPYDLICLDIMLPKKDGQQVLKEIRALEAEKKIQGLDRVKVIMSTALSDSKNIMESFRAQCEAYLPKPIDRTKLLEEIRSLGLID